MSALAKRLKVQSFVIISALSAGLVAVPLSAQAANATCNGLAVTITSSARVINATSGADVIVVQGAGIHSVNSGAGDDVICGSVGDDTINSGPGNDKVIAGDGNDVVSSLNGNDTVNGGSGNDTISSGTGNDTVTGGDGNDALATGDGSDSINSGPGNDSVTAGSGNDTISAGTGNDTISAGAGNDTVTGDAGTDSIKGDAGNDTVSGGAGNDTISAGNSNDTVSGDAGNDSIEGNAGDDTLNGGAGSDVLMGSSGSDRIDGGAQPDMFVGGTGTDRLTAGTPGDTCANDVADLITGICGYDTTGPEIRDVNLPKVVDAGETITVTWRITDASGIDTLGAGPDSGVGPNTRATLTGTQGFVYWSSCSLGVTRISGSSTDGVYKASCTVPVGAPNATYSFMISAADMFGNSLPGYSRFFDFQVQNGSNDYDAPSVSYEGGLSDSYRAGDDVTFTLRGIDETGVAGIGVFVLGPNGRLVDDQTLGWIDASVSPLTSGTEKDGIYTVSIKLAATAIPGEYTFLLGFSDTTGNRAWSEVKYVGYPSINVVP